MTVLAGMAIPMVHATRQHDAARTAARLLAARLQQARLEAARRNVTVAVRFDPEDLDRFGLVADGDGDGVLESDVTRGVDYPIGSASRLSDYVRDMGLRVNQDVPEPDAGGTIAAGSDPLRIGRSTVLSFSPIGSATSGTIYLAGRTGPQMAIRILGATGRMRVLRFDAASRQWHED